MMDLKTTKISEVGVQLLVSFKEELNHHILMVFEHQSIIYHPQELLVTLLDHKPILLKEVG